MGTNGFCSNLHKTNVNVHRATKLYQRSLQKQMKAKRDVTFLQNCKTNNVFPKFVRWKNTKYKTLRERIKYYTRKLNDALNKRRKELNKLLTENDNLKLNLLSSTSWMKAQLILFSVKRLQSNLCKTVLARHEKKLDALIINKRIHDGVDINPNSIITNLSNVELNEDEIYVLKVGLKHCLLIRPRESEMIVIMGDIYDQILKQNTLKDDHIYRHRAQTVLKAFTYNYLDLIVKQLFNDRKKIKALKHLRDRCMILKPDKGQEIVLINKTDYYQSLERLFGDMMKFQVLDHDSTLISLVTIRNYIQIIYKRGEINEAEMKEMRPKSAQVERSLVFLKSIKSTQIYQVFDL